MTAKKNNTQTTLHNDGNFLTHSLVGNTTGSNTTQNVINILNQTTSPSPNQSINQIKKAGE